MANEQAKFLNSRRRHKTDVAIARQVNAYKELVNEAIDDIVEEDVSEQKRPKPLKRKK